MTTKRKPRCSYMRKGKRKLGCHNEAKYLLRYETHFCDEGVIKTCLIHKKYFEDGEENDLSPYRIVSVMPVNSKLNILT